MLDTSDARINTVRPDTKDTNTQSLAGVSAAEHVSYPVAFQGRVMLVTGFALTT